MAEIICPKCGTSNPEDANFCNKCGRLLRQKKEKTCPRCGKSILASSEFCPECGADVRPRLHTKKETAQPNVAAPEPVYEEDEPVKSNKARNWTIGIIVALLAIGVASAFVYKNFVDDVEPEQVAVDSTDVELTPEQVLSTFETTLAQKNMLADRYVTSYVQMFEDPTKGRRIVGLRILSGIGGRSGYKIFEVTESDALWQVTSQIDRFVDNAYIITDREELMMETTDVPKAVHLNKNDYFYFVYLTRPDEVMEGAKSTLVFALYNINSHDVITLDMAGTVVTRENKNYFKGEFVNDRSSVEVQFLKSEAKKLQFIYKPTPEELALEAPKNAAQKWLGDNSAKINELRSTMNVVKMDVKLYDTPIFDREDIVDGSTVSNDEYMYMAAHNGTVYGFSKKSRSYFVVYAPVSLTGRSTTKISLNADASLCVEAESVKFNFDPRNFEASGIE